MTDRTPALLLLGYLLLFTWAAVNPYDRATWYAENIPIVGIVVSLVGLDATMNQTVHARWSYLPSEILEGERYVDIVTVHADGFRAVDYTRIHQTEPEPEVAEL